jgi:hypothetical protein
MCELNIPAEKIGHDHGRQLRKVPLSIEGMTLPCKYMQIYGIACLLQCIMKLPAMFDRYPLVIASNQ